jgi:hypothetical protein
VADLSNSAGAVFEIEATEIELDEGAIRDALRSGRLRSGDLVRIEGKWQTLLESPLFFEAATVAHRREGRLQFWKSAVRAVVALGVIGLIYLLRVWIRVR